MAVDVVDYFLKHAALGAVMLLDREISGGILLPLVLVTPPFEPPHQLRH